jgi:membrane fusion protein (multidrug efflux system)
LLKRSVIVPVVVLAIAVTLFLVIRYRWTAAESGAEIQKTDDAYVKADEVSLSTRITGTVRRVAVGDYQSVKAGQILVEIDDTDYAAAVDGAKAALDGARAEYAANQDAKRAAGASIAAAEAGVKQAVAAVAAAQAGISATQASTTQAESEFRRQQSLLAGKAATREQFEQVQATRDSAVAGLAGRNADLARAEAATAAAEATLAGARQQRAALESKDAALLAQIAARKAAITASEVNLAYTRVSAPSDGYVGEFRVHPGQLVSAGMQIAPLVESRVWIEADYRETQLARVRVGDPVDIHIDALSHAFHGHVEEIAPASGSQFSLLPPDNATGNYTKVVQRVPVRIAFDEDRQTELLRPGFSAEVAIHASGASGSSAR